MNVKKAGSRFHYHWMWFAVPIIGSLSLCFALFIGGGTHYWGPLESDLTNQFYPWRVFIHRWFSRGVFPYWDPHVFSGYPTVESQQMLNMHPFYLLSLLLNPNLGITLFTALNTLIATVGMLWGLRRWCGCSPMAAALGAGLYVFGALFAVRVMAGHITVVTALAWWPMAALSIVRIVRLLPVVAGREMIQSERAALAAVPQRLLHNLDLRKILAVAVVAHAMVCLAGAPQYIVYLFYIDLAILAAAARRYTWTASLAVLAGVWILALTVSAPQWLPALWYLPYTGRATSSGGATGLDLGPMQNFVLELVMPWPFGDDLNFGHLHFKNVWETATYPGSATLVLSLALIVRVIAWRLGRLFRRPGFGSAVSPLAVASAVILLLGCYMMVGGWLPGFGGFREPLKARALLAFGFATASAAIFDQGILRARRWTRSLWAGVIGVVLLIGNAGMYSGTQSFQELVKTFGPPMDPLAGPDYRLFLASPDDAALRYYQAYIAATLGIYFVILFLIGKPNVRVLMAVFLFWAALIDPFFHHARAWLARHSWQRAGLPAPIADYFEPRLEQSKEGLPWRVVLNPAIINRTHHMDGLYEYYGYDPLMPAQGVTRMLVKGVKNEDQVDKNAQRLELLQRVGARFDASQWLPDGRGDSEPGKVIEVPSASLFEVTRRVVAGTPGEQRFGPDMDGVHYLLPADQGGLASEANLPAADFSDYIRDTFTQADATTRSHSLEPDESLQSIPTGRPDEYGIRVSLKNPALVVYKGTWLPGWRVIVDGSDKSPAMFANNWMPAAIIPEGDHTVIFQYRPVAFKASLAIAVLGVAVTLGLLVTGRRRR